MNLISKQNGVLVVIRKKKPLKERKWRNHILNGRKKKTEYTSGIFRTILNFLRMSILEEPQKYSKIYRCRFLQKTHNNAGLIIKR